MMSILKFMRDESGATSVEHALVATLIALAVVGAAGALGAKLKGTFNRVASNLG